MVAGDGRVEADAAEDVCGLDCSDSAWLAAADGLEEVDVAPVAADGTCQPASTWTGFHDQAAAAVVVVVDHSGQMFLSIVVAVVAESAKTPPRTTRPNREGRCWSRSRC